MFKAVEDLQQISRSQLDATSQSAAALSRGLQQMVQEASALSKRSMENGSEMINRLIGVSSIETAIQVQSDYAKSTYESYVDGARRFGELYAAMVKDTCRPFEEVVGQSQVLVRQ